MSDAENHLVWTEDQRFISPIDRAEFLKFVELCLRADVPFVFCFDTNRVVSGDKTIGDDGNFKGLEEYTDEDITQGQEGLTLEVGGRQLLGPELHAKLYQSVAECVNDGLQLLFAALKEKAGEGAAYFLFSQYYNVDPDMLDS